LWLTTASALPAEAPDAAERAREALANDVRRAIDLADVEVEVAEGSIVGEILRVARERGAETIVMGTHGLSGFDRLVLGSVTEKVLHNASCPVLVIPPSAGAPRPDRVIVCGIDRAEASRRALELASARAAEQGACLVVVHAFEDFSAEDPRLAHHFNSDACWHAAEPELRAAYSAMLPQDARRAGTVELVVQRGRPYRLLLDTAAARSADLIVVGAAGWNPPYGSTTSHVLRAATCPVLVIPPDRSPSAADAGLPENRHHRAPVGKG
jgi:nucleotide-binding universal stress UspA family protein